MFNLKDLEVKIIKRISDYIGFDVNEIFDVSDQITIFGGAVRDSLAGLEIHDIDILCMSESAHKLRDFLKQKDYVQVDLYDQDSLNMYKGISLISDPWTFVNNDRKIIQIIRPAAYRTVLEYSAAYRNLIKNVDISCCGVFLEKSNNEIQLKEACKHAIIHSLSKIYEVNMHFKMYSQDRTMHRTNKLQARGWISLYRSMTKTSDLCDLLSSFDLKNSDILKYNRMHKLNTLEFKPEREYKIWTEEEYLIANKKPVITYSHYSHR